MVSIVKACTKEIESLPLAVREDLADALALLDEGLTLSLPLSRPMPSLGRGVHELRLKDRSGNYRIIYCIRGQADILLVHAFKKTSQQTPRQAIEVAKRRMRELKV